VAADDLPFAVLGATVAALTTGQSWLDALPDTLKMRRRQLGGLIAAPLPRCSLAATAGDLPCVAGLPTYRRWRATAQYVPRPWPRRTRTRTENARICRM